MAPAAFLDPGCGGLPGTPSVGPSGPEPGFPDAATLRARVLPRAAESMEGSDAVGLIDGWLDLVAVVRAGAREAALRRWLRRYPDHPGRTLLRPHEAQASAPRRGWARPGRIGVLLPLTGRWAEPARAVRAGLLDAAREADAVKLQFFDSAAGGLAAAERAARDGRVELFIGPLRREQVRRWVRLHPGGPGVLLNFLPGAAPPAYRQFGLAPEDEARALAELAAADGRGAGLLLYPDDAWGRRVARAYREYCRGGCARRESPYDPAADDFGALLREALGVARSAQRHRALERLLGRSLAFEPRRRRDLDHVVLLGGWQSVRKLRPQLRFWHAEALPVYTTSHALPPDDTADADLGGVHFVDMPFILNGSGASRSAHPRFYALGRDALRLALQGSDAPLPGYAGTLLWEGQGGRIHRRLVAGVMAAAGPRPACAQ